VGGERSLHAFRFKRKTQPLGFLALGLVATQGLFAGIGSIRTPAERFSWENMYSVDMICSRGLVPVGTR